VGNAGGDFQRFTDSRGWPSAKNKVAHLFFFPKVYTSALVLMYNYTGESKTFCFCYLIGYRIVYNSCVILPSPRTLRLCLIRCSSAVRLFLPFVC